MSSVRLCLAVFLLGFGLASAPARAETFATGAEFAFLQDFDTGGVLFEKNADEPMPPASLAKLLTAEIVFQVLKAGKLTLDDLFDVSEKAWREGGAP